MADDHRVGRMDEGRAAEVKGSKSLSDHDRAVLNRVFNPTLLSNDLDYVAPHLDDDKDDDDVLTTEGHSIASDADRDALMRLQMEIESVEAEGVKAVEEGGNPRLAADLFSKAIDMDPNRASAYNNRAQAFRLLANVQDAESDLDKAIELSRGRGRVACQAYTQRGLVRKLQGKTELALEDFGKAAALGSHFSRSQIVSMNPYAALCNSMMTEMMEKIRRGEIDP
jgi:tetratricopeptide (TPR) repeat protein